MGRGSPERTPGGRLHPCCLHPSPPTLPTRPAEQAGPLCPLVPRQCRNPSGSSRRTQTSRSRDRIPLCTPYLGTEPARSSPRPLPHSRRRPLTRPNPLDPSPLSILSSCPRAQPRLPRQVRRRLKATVPAAPTHLCRISQAARKRQGFPLLLASTLPPELGGLCQATLWRASSCARLPRPLHPSRGHHQPPPRRFRARSGYFPLEGLCPRK